MTITSVSGIKVGHWDDPIAQTGVTVIDLPEPNVAAAEVRGAAPGSRELALLQTGRAVESVQAIVLTGGSAFGLASADGVVRELEADGRGHPTLAARVPIVPAGVIYDLRVGDASVRPGPDEGAAAYRAASSDPVPSGQVGVGMGATVAGWRGAEIAGGIGSHSMQVKGLRTGDSSPIAQVGVLAVVNAVGDAFTLEGTPLTGGSHRPQWPTELPSSPNGEPANGPTTGENTTLVVMATDARLDRSGLARVMVRMHDAIGACVRPSHTRYDGDMVFAISVGEVEVSAEAIGEAAFVSTGEAIAAVF
jgi:L-aminopeptidase/D-esterase-like protein